MTRDLQECTQIYTGSTFWHACSTGMPKSTPCVNLLFKKLLKAIMHSNCTLIALLYMYATQLSFVLISVILTKLCCFKCDNPTVLTLSTRGQSNLTKSASRGPIPRLGVIIIIIIKEQIKVT